jgi:hypothetical protein
MAKQAEAFSWIEGFLDIHAEKVPGGPGQGRWRRVYPENEVRRILQWTWTHFEAEDHLRARCNELYEENQNLRTILDERERRAVQDYFQGAARD